MTAPDKAKEAAPFALAVLEGLLVASADYTSREQKRAGLKKAFQANEALQDRLRQLEPLAPNASIEGRAEAASLREIAGGGR